MDTIRIANVTQKALLLFAHQGRSYLPLVLQALEALNVVCLVLSSKPRDPVDLANLRACDPAELWEVDHEFLDELHVDASLKRAHAAGYQVVGALATFEGYRVLMASTNQKLQAVDAQPAVLVRCMDKYLCRKALYEQGLSHAAVDIVDADHIELLHRSGKHRFLKPRRGAGSFACFRLDATFSKEKLHALQQQMRDDLAFRAIFSGQFEFIAEDYISGDEYSFEVLVAQGESFVIGVHAKYLDDSSGTTLETSNSCPAPRLDNNQQLTGERYIQRCLSALDLDEGCYHIEARDDSEAEIWDIIEINARMGGALINHSIGVFTDGTSMLDLWVQAVCRNNPSEHADFHRRLTRLRESDRRGAESITHGTVFFSRYGERNRTLSNISIETLPRQPDICELPVRVGTRLPDSERGIFILNALWRVDVNEISDELDRLSTMLDQHFVTEYAA